MNTQEKVIAGLLGLMLVGWLFYSQTQQAKQAKIVAQQPVTTEQAVTASNAVQAAVSYTHLTLPTILRV